MSDINFQFSPWVSAMFVLVEGFWPLTIAAAGAAIWLFLARRSRAAWIVAIVIGIPWFVSAGANLWLRIDDARSHAAGLAYDRAHRQTLATDTVVSGMHLPANTVLVTDEAFHLSSVELSKPTVLFGVPLKDTVNLRDAKLEGSQTLQHDATIDGVPCAASDGASFENGRLTDCRLAHPATIDGVPCGGYITIHANFLGCVLATSYRRYGATWYAGTDVRGNQDELTFTIGSQAPSLRVYGSPLSQGTMVEYQKGAIASVTPINAPLHYRGCTITSLERRDGAMTAQVEGKCSIPALTNGRVSVPNF